jgi:CubicO group peptidase (beta-lactamase class C family)
MRWLKRIFYGLLALIALASVALMVTGNSHVFTGLRQTYLIGKSKPDIYDKDYFECSVMRADKPEPWPMHKQYGLLPLSPADDAFTDSTESTALLVFKNDSLLFEKYYNDGTDQSLTNSFSMSKSFTAMLVGRAIDEGYIKSLDQPVSDFLPEFKDGLNAKLTIRHLLTMTSGIPFGESYSSPFGFMARAYYGTELEEETLQPKYRVEKEPGTFWSYEGGNTILLGLIVKKATGRTPSEYFFQKFWSCIGAEHDAYWNLDHEDGLEKTYTGFYATARDFARIGKLYAHHGVWGNDTLLSPAFVKECITPVNAPDKEGVNVDWYGLQWWMGNINGLDYFGCRGLRGQYIIAVPEKNILMVRLGHTQSKDRQNHMPTDMIRFIEMAINIGDKVN